MAGWEQRAVSKLTIDQAEAWIAARDACEREAREIGRSLRASVGDDPRPSAHLVRQNAALADLIADAIARLEPPRALPDGLSERGA